MDLKLTDFDYDLPDELIAQHPTAERDGSRLMVLQRKDRRVIHQQFRELVGLLRSGDCLVVNETRVFPARLKGFRPDSGGAVELLLLRECEGLWEAMARPGRRLRPGSKIAFQDTDLVATVTEVLDSGHRRIQFEGRDSLKGVLALYGHTPLPPYIDREDTPEDRERYQTVFGKTEGAIAAPTAGLHFTTETLDRIREAGVNIAPVLLHVGAGTFKPVVANDPRQHEMESEYFEVGLEAAETINRCRREGGRIIAVGTTSVRVLESNCVQNNNGWVIQPGSGWTQLFIFQPYSFRLVDGLITNFHLPKSTLLMLVSAFAHREFVMEAYKEAVREKYRMYSYGDAMVIL